MRCLSPCRSLFLIFSLIISVWYTPVAFAEAGDDAIKKGNKLVQAGKIDEALVVYRKASAAHPKNAELSLVLGLALANKGESVEAARYLRSSVQAEPSFQGWYSLGLVYANSNAFEQAVEAYQEALKISPRAFNAWYQLGLVRQAQGHFDAALEAFGKSAEMNPQFEDAYLGLGSASFWAGNREGALRQVDRLRLMKAKSKADALEAWLKRKESSPPAETVPASAA